MENSSQKNQSSISSQKQVGSVLDMNKRIERDEKRKQGKDSINMSKEEINGHLSGGSTKDSVSSVNNRIEHMGGRNSRTAPPWMESTIPRRDNTRVSVSSVNNDIERREMATREKQKEGGQDGVKFPSKNDRVKVYQKNKETVLKAIKSKVKSRKENRSSLNAMSSMVIFVAFTIAITSDILDILLDGTVVGYPFSLLANFGICPFIGFLWWSLGVDSSNNRLKKGSRRMFASLGIETIIDFFPTLIIWCLINLLDYLGYLDNKDWIKTLNKNRTKDVLPLGNKSNNINL